MSTMDCSQFADQLDEWMRGQRSAAARVHVRECHLCRALADDFSAIVGAARKWAADDSVPPPRLWTSLRAQLQEEGLIGQPARPSAPRAARESRDFPDRPSSRWLGGWFPNVLRPALAGGYLAALLALSILFVGPTGKQIDDSQWLERTQVSIKPLTAELDSAERSILSNVATASPLVAASFHQNLQIVDRDIALCEKSVREQPENELARDFLYQAYEQKADLLAEIADRTVNNP